MSLLGKEAVKPWFLPFLQGVRTAKERSLCIEREGGVPVSRGRRGAQQPEPSPVSGDRGRDSGAPSERGY